VQPPRFGNAAESSAEVRAIQRRDSRKEMRAF